MKGVNPVLGEKCSYIKIFAFTFIQSRWRTPAPPFIQEFYLLSDTFTWPLSYDCISIQRGKEPLTYLCSQVSLTRSPPSESEGSDGRFLISYDRTLVIKEVSSEDIADMHSNLSNYHQVRRLSSFVLSLSSLVIALLLENIRKLFSFPYNPFCCPRSTWHHVFEN